MPNFGSPNSNGGKSLTTKPTTIPQIIEQKCLVCKSPHRNLIDKMLASGLSYSEIERQFDFAGIKRRSLANHKDKHLGWEEAAIREIIEREAIAAQRNFEEGVGRLVTKNTYLEVALQKAYDALINNETIVEPKDAVKVIETLSRLQEQHQDVALDELRLQFNMFMQSVKELVERDRWDKIVGRTADLLRAAGQPINWDNVVEDEPIDAIVVEQLPAEVVNTQI